MWLSIVHKGQTDNKSAEIQIIKPSSEPIMILFTDVYLRH